MASRISAVGGSNLEIVVVVDMAAGARNSGVAVRERETGGAVIENYICPGRGVVALRTIRGGERGTRLRVRRIVGLLPGGEVATGITAIRGGNLEIVVVVNMAAGARNVGVASGERKASGTVIELCA